jgi:hypothetical protein
MRRLASIFILALLMGVGGGESKAAWPANGVRTVGFCNTVNAAIVDCPFLSDADSFWGGNNTQIFVDYYQYPPSSPGVVTSSACRQSWTGTAVACGTAASTTTYGNQDVRLGGFQTIPGPYTWFDYFYVQLFVANGGSFGVAGATFE